MLSVLGVHGAWWKHLEQSSFFKYLVTYSTGTVNHASLKTAPLNATEKFSCIECFKHVKQFVHCLLFSQCDQCDPVGIGGLSARRLFSSRAKPKGE